MAKTGLTKGQEARLLRDPVLRACYLEKAPLLGEREAFAACIKEARELAKKEGVKARAAQKAADRAAREAKKKAERQEKARQKAADKAQTAARVEASPSASPAKKARARGAAKVARKTAQKDKEIAKVAAQTAASAIAKSSAQARTVAMHEGVTPAPAPTMLDADALILLPEAERKRVLAMSGKAQRRLVAKELSLLLRRVRNDIASLKAARRQRLRVLKTRAKEALSMIRRRIVEARTRYLQEMAKLRSETAEAKKGRSSGIEEVNQEIGAALGQATGRQRAIRDTQSEIRAMRGERSPAQMQAAQRRQDLRQQSDFSVAHELEVSLPGAEVWWNAEGKRQARFSDKKTPAKMSRAEHVVHVLTLSPQILDDFFEKKAAAALKAKEAELKAIAKRQSRKEIQRTGRATRRYGRLSPMRSRGVGGRPGRLEPPAPFLTLLPSIGRRASVGIDRSQSPLDQSTRNPCGPPRPPGRSLS